MTPVVRKFISQVSSINESDYGDFMRVANVYLNGLRKDCTRTGIYDLEPKISEMQMYLQFAPSWDVPTTKARLLKDAQYIDEVIMAHKQDWESVQADM